MKKDVEKIHEKYEFLKGFHDKWFSLGLFRKKSSDGRWTNKGKLLPWLWFIFHHDDNAFMGSVIIGAYILGVMVIIHNQKEVRNAEGKD